MLMCKASFCKVSWENIQLIWAASTLRACAGRDRLAAEADRQQQRHQNSSDMRISTSREAASIDAANAGQTSKDGVPQHQFATS